MVIEEVIQNKKNIFKGLKLYIIIYNIIYMDFRYLTESKNEFNNYLSSILIPHLYKGIAGMLKYSIQTYEMLKEKQKKC